MKKLTCIFLALILTFALVACQPEDDAISGVATVAPPEPEIKTARYENQTHGIILEYPETYERVGNLDEDGFLTFEGDGNTIALYVPDTEADVDAMNADDYALKVLKLAMTPDSSFTTYGKTSGYRTFTYTADTTTLEFVAEGVDGFYRFSFTSARETFSESDRVFNLVMSSIRIDDGVFISLYKMSKEYTVLLQYVTTQQYVTDADYANHCLNNYDLSGDCDHIHTARETFVSIKTELAKISNFKRGEEDGFDDLWADILSEAIRLQGVCDEAITAIDAGDYDTAKKLARSQFSFDLSEDAALLISAIQAEVSEYY